MCFFTFVYAKIDLNRGTIGRANDHDDVRNPITNMIYIHIRIQTYVQQQKVNKHKFGI
jgi:hypothetical protein